LPALPEDTSAGSKDEQHKHYSGSGTGSFASLIKLAAGNPAVFSNIRSTMKNNKLVVGKSVSNKHLQFVVTKRTVDLFVSRLYPNTTEDELVECVESVVTDIKLAIHDVTCT